MPAPLLSLQPAPQAPVHTPSPEEGAAKAEVEQAQEKVLAELAEQAKVGHTLVYCCMTHTPLLHDSLAIAA